jgi:antitoxin ParD1/3/4
LIRQARNLQAKIDCLTVKFEKAENSGFTNDSKDNILKQSKDLLSQSC